VRLAMLRMQFELYPVMSPLAGVVGWLRRVGEALPAAPSGGACGRQSSFLGVAVTMPSSTQRAVAVSAGPCPRPRGWRGRAIGMAGVVLRRPWRQI
jgi:hypothetical protein